MLCYNVFLSTILYDPLSIKDLLTTNDILDENFNKFEKYFNNI